MNFFGAAFLSGLAVFPLMAHAVGDAPSADARSVQAAPTDTAQAISALIADLSNDSFALREAATKKLWKFGETALDELKQAASGTDPEAAHRARELLHKIELHITPDTDPSVIALVERYKKASASQKASLLNEMQEKHAYRQILKLYGSETDQKIRSTLQVAVGDIAIFAARERLLAGDPTDARELLELAPANAKGLMALAAFHRANGTLEQELQRAKTSKAKGAAAWQLALQRAAGRLDEAYTAAIDAGEPMIAASMAMLAGDPVPWLEHCKASHSEGNTVDLYTALALKRWQGKPMLKTELEPAIKLLSSRNPLVRSLASSSLFLLGDSAPAEAALAKLSQLDAFGHFEALERIPEALAAIGLDPEKPDFPAWAASRFDRLIEEPDDCEVATTELIVIACYLESRGLNNDLATAFDKQLSRLAAKDLDSLTGFFNAFFEAPKDRPPYLREFFRDRIIRNGIIGPFLRVGPVWAGDDENRWDELLIAAFGDNDEHAACWKWLAELKPDATRKQRLEAMLALSGYSSDPDHLAAQWRDLAWAAIAKADADSRPTLLARLAYLVTKSGDVANSLKIRDANPTREGDKDFDGLYLLQLSAAGRWEEASQVILKALSSKDDPSQNSRPDLHAYAAACLRRAGHPDEAAVHDAWVEKLALGDSMRGLRIGHGYAFGGDYERCSLWWERAAREAAPDAEWERAGGESAQESGSFADVLAVHSVDLLKRGIWKQAASTAEALAQIYSGRNFCNNSPLLFLRIRIQADQAHALAMLETDRPRALGLLDACYALLPCDGSLADHFFPALRNAGLIKQHDDWFEATWEHLQAVIKHYPESDNTRNTAAWLAARAMRHLDEAEAHLNKALATRPNQSAYLDTMAELQFARGNRNQAIEWSDKSVNFMPADDDVRRQNDRFKNGPLPK